MLETDLFSRLLKPIVLEKIEWLIDKLKRQYDSNAGAVAMLNTLQLLQQELVTHTSATPAVQRISVVMPAPQWNPHATDELDEYETESLRGADEKKVVFELEPYLEEEDAEPEEMPSEEDEPVMLTVLPPQIPPSYPAKEEQLSTQTSCPDEPVTPAIVTPSVHATVMPNPVPETDKKSLNDLHESPLPDSFNRYQEPIKDLKRAISINDRYQYINNLFGGDEAAYDRSIKTINHFNIFSEAEYWIRREISTKYGWEDNSRLAQQFYELVSRRFA